ncbi:META domain-containing protein [Deinococcus sp. Arct2-2]|uniref:META domain-containing protein n=1 Tax=Deinococcus sp. Arct2-2 TaxID=2568653 RepID=UPI0010A42CF3|nr:META domain-containing protein [Deinococcus sp. Arct2-2]THF70327.1 META domain-containing protein [Deinococcus sp. Arct2-2]
MRFLLLPFLLLASSATAQAVPAPLNGIWQLNDLTVFGKAQTALPSTQLVISGGQLRGMIGCGTYSGTIAAANNQIKLQVTPLPPRANERCLYALPGAFHGALNASGHYIISGDTRVLVLFSTTTRLTFQRIGYVTPVKP